MFLYCYLKLQLTLDSPVNELNYPTEAILSCDEYRAFWISWRHRVLKFGEGINVGMDMIGEMTLNADQVLWIHSISVASMPEYFPDPVEWLLPIHIGKYN